MEDLIMKKSLNNHDVTLTAATTRTGRAHKKKRLFRFHKPSRSFLFYIGIFGPGLIAANAGNDPGGVLTYSQMGAQYGYQMLWVMVVLTVGVGIVQEMCARMGVVTGKGLTDLIRENFPLRLTVFILFSLLLANGGIIVSEFIGITAAMGLFNVPAYISAPCGGLLIWLLVVKGSASWVEKVFVALTLAFFAYILSAFLAHPDGGQVLRGSLVPVVQLNGGYLLILIAAIGTTISPYMQTYVQSAVVERGLPLRDYKYERLEIYVSSIFSNAISCFIIISTAATLFVHSGGRGVILNSAAQAAESLQPFLGVLARDAFALGLLGAALLAASVLPLTTSYSLTESFGFENGVNKKWREAPVFWTLFTLLIVVGVVVAMVPDLPVVQILLNLYLLNGLLLPIILFSVLWLVNNKRLMGSYTNGLVYNILAYTLTIVVSMLALVYLVVQVASLFGVQLLK
jgi:Mn2+/Fe2+ NRAMP family transporter